MRRTPAGVVSVIPLVLVAIAGAMLLAGSPRAPSGPAVGAERTEPAAPMATLVRLPETAEVPSPTATAHVLDVHGLRVLVPRLRIDLPLAVGELERDVPRPGFAGSTPESVALVYPTSAAPGAGGNTYVYAHARAGMFLSLWNVTLGDAVLVVRPDGSVLRAYAVALIVPRVDPGDTHWLDAGGLERITLQTSTGPDAQDPRFIVVAYPAAAPDAAPRLP